MTADSESVITVHGLKNSFGDQIVHDGLDLEVRRGEISAWSADRAPANPC